MRPEPRQRPSSPRPRRRHSSRFRRLAITHAAMIGADAAMLVALADSLFLSIDPSAARGQVLLFLVVSFAPYVVLAPLIGPAIDRMAGGRRLVIQIVAVIRVVLSILIAFTIDSLALFPLIFAALVMQRAYTVSKQAIVPSVVRNDTELVEANSKLGLIAGITGFVAVIPAGALQLITGSTTPTLIYSAVLFGYGLLAGTRLPHEKVITREPRLAEARQLHEATLHYAAVSMTVLRCAVGFVFFHLAFWFREADVDDTTKGTVLFGVAVSLSALGTMGGNALSPHLRKTVSEEMMLQISLAVVVAGGVATALVGGFASGIAIAVLANFAAAVGRLGFEAIVQREAPAETHGQVFAVNETRFQLGWALAGLIPVIIIMPGTVGLLIVGLGAALGLVNYVTALHGIGNEVREAARQRFAGLVAKLPVPKRRLRRSTRARSEPPRPLDPPAPEAGSHQGSVLPPPSPTDRAARRPR